MISSYRLQLGYVLTRLCSDPNRRPSLDLCLAMPRFCSGSLQTRDAGRLEVLVKHLANLQLQQSHFVEMNANPLLQRRLWGRLDSFFGDVDIVNELGEADVDMLSPCSKVRWPPQTMRKAIVHGK